MSPKSPIQIGVNKAQRAQYKTGVDKPKEPITKLVWISQKSPIQTDVYKPKEPITKLMWIRAQSPAGYSPKRILLLALALLHATAAGRGPRSLSERQLARDQGHYTLVSDPVFSAGAGESVKYRKGYLPCTRLPL